jgi:geranylgeranyl diphosphate synthase type II
MPIAPMLEALNAEIRSLRYGEQPPELYDPIRYLMALGGKRMRPLLTLLSSSMFTPDWQPFVRPAIAVEVFHNFTLMHDDIMDAAPLRRGQPTVHVKWNPNVAILSGDVMLVCAYALLSDIPDGQLRTVLKKFNRCAAEVCEGQQLDMNFETRTDVQEAEYLDMIRLKTAVLLGFSLEFGGLLAGADEQNTRLLYEAGESIGIGFQLKDDLLDVFGDQAKFGKQVGGDIIANKKTFLLIKALQLAGGEQKRQLDGWLSAKTFDPPEKIRAVTGIYNALAIDRLTEAKMNEYFALGLSCLDRVTAPPERKAPLRDFVEKLIYREN